MKDGAYMAEGTIISDDPDKSVFQAQGAAVGVLPLSQVTVSAEFQRFRRQSRLSRTPPRGVFLEIKTVT
jgi:hypothetical protein